MNRSLYKGPFVCHSLISKFAKIKKENISPKDIMIKTYSRASCIIPTFVGFTFEIHNGRRFVRVYITEQMIGRKLGEFAPTRTYTQKAEHKLKKAMKKTSTKTTKR